ncbi:Ig-like domain-containing protein [Nocardioides sp. SYSU D00038]|uniref:L,D-transpeptidase n=1 Tax=Nocardioides sp. SYSU D00038 TaxID=2812554 RepID=UPI001967243A|nr:Ig-like domain-containing protein [Nocardioides sp. SYSU D00038]
MTVRTPARRRLAAATAVLLGLTLLTACDAGSALSGDDSGSDSDAPGASESPEVPEATITANVRRGAKAVGVDRLVEVRAVDGTLTGVTVRGTGDAPPVEGTLAGDGSRWSASDRLEPGTRYTIEARLQDGAGSAVTRRQRFTTRALTLDEQTYPTIAPLAGETVGVGMPVVVQFDLPVADKAAMERQMKVTSSPQQPGAWRWFSDNEARWRPKKYWKPGTEVTVDVDVNGVDAGNGIYGQESRRIAFDIGDSHVYKVDARTHQMKVFANGKLLRTLPTTTGKPGFTTRSGTKVIIEKFDARRMNSETVGIPADSAEAYDIDNVQWAMRLTFSGEFIHAAPWSVGSQGYANVSHGCTGLSTANADWLYHLSQRGDVVEYTGTDRPMTLENGYGDWNLPFREYKRGSALG